MTESKIEFGAGAFWVVLYVATAVVGYLTNNVNGIVWGTVLWASFPLNIVPIVGALLYQFVIIPYANSLIFMCKATNVMTTIWLAYAWLINILFLVAFIKYLAEALKD